MEWTLFDPTSSTVNEDCYYQYYYQEEDIDFYDKFNKLLLTFLLFNTAVLFSFWFSGFFLINETIEVEKKEKKEIKYEDLYPIDMMNEALKKKTEVSKNTVILENTPDGNVLIRYNSDREGFEYWCDTKNIKYNYLETVARKFVITNFCIELYKDRFKSIENQEKEINESSIENNEDDSEKKINNELSDTITEDIDDVFVKPKKLEKTVIKEENNVKKEKTEVVAKEANKYIYMGKIKEYKWLTKPKIEQKVKKMSYSEWFNLN